MKERLFQLKKKVIALFKLSAIKFGRLFCNTHLSANAAFEVPIVLNNRNRFTYLKGMVEWLTSRGYKNIYILDNDSTYAPLLDYYKHVPAKVIYLGKNVGYKALWECELFEKLKNGYYVYSDSDLLPVTECPPDLIYRLYLVLNKYPIEKCGPALKIDDLPDHYGNKAAVLAMEKNYWIKAVEPNVFDAPVDTTFALYKPLARGNAEECNAYRVGGDLTFRHLPWYENSSNLGPEATYYKESVSSSSYWYTRP